MTKANASSEDAAAKRRSVVERVGTELRAYLITSLYLWVWLSALLLYEHALLAEQGVTGVTALHFGVAAGKALILGKFVLLGESLGAGTRIGARTLVHRIAFRSLALVVVLVAFTLVEELVVGWVHGRSAAATLAELGSAPFEHAASALLMLLVLVPFVAAKQISLALGPGVLRHHLTRDTREGE